MQKIKIGFGQLAAYTVVILLVGLALGRFAGEVKEAAPMQIVVEGERGVVTFLPAVDQSGNGVVGTLETTVKPGSGLVLVNVNSILAEFDTQLSGRTAAEAAANFTKLDLSKYDIVYNIRVNASVIEGPSAGAAMAISIAASLQGKELGNTTMITGTISSNGAIGKVGAITEKAQAAKDFGATRFLVPRGQSTDRQVKRQRECSNFDSVQYCEIRYATKNVNVGEAIGIEVIEVKNVEEALGYFAG